MDSRGRRSTPYTPMGSRGRNKIPCKVLLLALVSLICIVTLTWAIRSVFFRARTGTETPWGDAPLNGWRASSAPRSYWLPPPGDSNGYLIVHCFGGIYRQRSEISDAVIAARILNATLVLPRLGSDYKFRLIYNVDHFIKSLRYDVSIVTDIPQRNITEPYKVRPPKTVSIDWITKVALPKLRKNRVISISHLRIATEDAELQRLRCRVSFGALKFTPAIARLGEEVVDTLHRTGYFIAVHVHIESDASILSPTEVSVVLSAMGFGTSTSMFLTAGEGVKRAEYLRKFNDVFRNAKVQSEEVDEERFPIWYRTALDYMICVRSEVFLLVDYEHTCDVVGHRMFEGFRRTLHPNRALKEMLREGEGHAIRQLIVNTSFSGPRVRVRGESFTENPFPECFCRVLATDPDQRCPREHTWLLPKGSQRRDDDDDGWRNELE